ncbi:MAG: hypothetical protein ABFD18_02180 [Syntrophomonas sp.]
MTEGLAIWSRVVLAQLNRPRRINQELVHILKSGFKSFEDVKVKIKELSWKRQGQAVETLVNLDLLFLVEEHNGVMKLVSQETSLRDRVPFTEFDGNWELLENDRMIGFNGDIKKLSWQADVNDNEVKLILTVDYLLVATREQVVKLSEQSEGLVESRDLSEKLEELKHEIARTQNEKQNLQHQVFLYERDISSLRRGIKKVEDRNSLLNKESKQYQEMLSQLQFAIREQERQLNRYAHNISEEEQLDNYLLPGQMKEQADNSELSLGRRVKRLFMNSI